MNKLFTDNAWDDYLYWANTNKQILKRINKLIDDIDRHPYEGIGKPEQLKYALSGFWSRRIDEEHRIVYQYNEEVEIINFISFKYHYE